MLNCSGTKKLIGWVTDGYNLYQDGRNYKDIKTGRWETWDGIKKYIKFTAND